MDKNDLISRKAAIGTFEKYKSKSQTLVDAFFLDKVMSILDTIPAIDPEEMRPKGQWKTKTVQCCYVLYCSECGFDGLGAGSAFCPHCGAMMTED